MTPPLYRRVLGARFDELPARVRELHDLDGVRVWNGRASVERGKVQYVASDHLAELTLAILQKDRQRDAFDIKFMADVFDIEFGTGCRIWDHPGGRMRYHLTTPFCQTSKRSRVRNRSVMAPEHNSDITMSAAYILA